MLKIGTALNLQYKNGKKVESYYCKIIEEKGDYIFIDYPINESTRKTTYFTENTSLLASFIGKDNIIYSFKTKILAKIKLRVPALIMKLPQKENMKKVQRREFIRVAEAIDLAVHCPEDSFEPFTTVTADISGGGLAFYLSNNQIDKRNKILNIWIAFQIKQDEFFYVSTKVEFVRLNLLENKHKTCSVKFIDLPKQDQEKIIYYCFEKQREARKKENKR